MKSSEEIMNEIEDNYMELPCKYCLKLKLVALKCNEYTNGKVVVSATCENCGRNQKYNNQGVLSFKVSKRLKEII